MKIKNLLLFAMAICAMNLSAYSQSDNETPTEPSEEELGNIMTFTTDKAEGEKITFTISTKQPYWIDWGTGEWKYYSRSTWQKKTGTKGANSDIRICGIIVHNISCMSNDITSIDVSQNESLELLHCGDNKLTTIDVTKNENLKTLHCEDNMLTSVDVSKNPHMSWIKLNNNNIEDIDVSTCSELTELDCINTGITSLDLKNNPILSAVYADNNNLTDIDITSNPEINVLSLSNNKIKNLDLTASANLQVLYCDNNEIENLNLNENPILMWLYCGNNQITDIDLSNNTEIKILDISNNRLNSLNISNATILNELYCYGNNLTELNLTNNTSLAKLYCYNNDIKGNSMSSMINSLPTCSDGNGHLGIVLKQEGFVDGNSATTADVENAKNKNWLVKYFDGSEWFDYEGMSSIKETEEQMINITRQGNEYVFEDMPDGKYTIYSIDGSAIYTGISTGEIIRISLPQAYYIISCPNGKHVKF